MRSKEEEKSAPRAAGASGTFGSSCPDNGRRRPLVIVIAASPIWNVPPLFNVARELANNGFRCLVVGYQANDLPACERLQANLWILRLDLRSRSLRVASFRKLLATFEFLRAANRILRRLRPNAVVTFNEPASIVLSTRLDPSCVKTAWFLEFPEKEFVSYPEGLLLTLSSTFWRRADIIVAPTIERLALHVAHRPECMGHKSFVVHNTPTLVVPEIAHPSPRAVEAAGLLRKAGDEGRVRLIYAGAIGNRYAIDRLIHAVDQCDSAFLLLLGKKHDLSLQEVSAALSTCRHPERIAWVDEVPYKELHHVLSHADVGFAHYLGDTLNTRFSAPGKVYEYLKAGLVVLTDSQCCLAQAIEATSCGAFFEPPGTVDGIRDALQNLIGKRELLSEKKESARALFREVLCLDRQLAPFVAHLVEQIDHPTQATSRAL